jgi:hypothetical protein
MLAVVAVFLLSSLCCCFQGPKFLMGGGDRIGSHLIWVEEEGWSEV